MKLTPYKIARIKMSLPQQDRDKIEEQQKEGKFSPEMQSLLSKAGNFHSPKRLSKTKGAFGKKGINRSLEQKRQKKMLGKLIEEARQQEKEESTNSKEE